METKKLREDIDNVSGQISKLVVTAKKEGRSLNSEEQVTYDKMYGDLERMEQELAGADRIERWENKLLGDTPAKPKAFVQSNYNQVDENNILRWIATRGTQAEREYDYCQDDIKRANVVGNSYYCPLNDEIIERVFGDSGLRTNVSTHASELVTSTLADRISEKLKAYGGLLPYCYSFTTPDGGPFSLPTSDTTGLTGAIVAEAADDTELAITVADVDFGSYLVSSKIQVLTYQMIREGSKFNLPQWVARVQGTVLARTIADFIINGTGSGQPTGIFATTGGLTTGVTAAAPTEFTYEELVDFIYSVDQAYHGNARWAVGTGFRKAVMKMVDENARPIWLNANEAGLAGGNPPTLLGYPVVLESNMPTSLTAAAKVAAFGDFAESTHVRLVGDLQVSQSQELFWKSRQTAIMTSMSIDVKNPQPAAAKVFKMGAGS